MFTYTSLHDGRRLGLFTTQPTTPAKGYIMVLHEAFGITPHIQRVCAQYSAAGYVCAAPALFMPASGKAEGIVLPQNKEGLDTARSMIIGTPRADLVAMLQASATWAGAQGLPTVALGFCWGGSCAYVAGVCVPGLKAAVGYYGGMLAQLCAEAQPACPTLIHLATQDRYIPLTETVKAFQTHHPAAQVMVHEADHGFNRDDGVTYNPTVAAYAQQESLKFIEKALA
jgi:carboxymethylenebutenolidase